MVSRREYLHGASAVTLASLAGCTGVPLVGGNGGDGEQDAAVVEARNVTRRAQFGRAVATADDVLAVGAPAALNDAGNFGGAAFVYEHDGDEWVKEARLQPNPDDFAGPHYDDPTGRLSFGQYVEAVDGTVVVGTAESPAAYVYERGDDGWRLASSLYPDAVDAVRERFPDVDDEDVSAYARSMAFDGETLALATHCAVESAEVVVEPVHVFEARDGDWTEVAALRRSEPREWDRFGYAIGVDDGTLAAAGLAGGDGEDYRPVVSVYRREDDGGGQETDGWAKVRELRPDVARAHAGSSDHDSVAVSGDAIALGNVLTEDASRYVVVFGRDGGRWVQQGRLRPDSLSEPGAFGETVALDDGTLVATAPDAEVDSEAGVDGSAFRYDRDGSEWTRSRRYAAGDAVEDARFGFAADVSSDYVAVGGRQRRDALADRDAVYVFER